MLAQYWIAVGARDRQTSENSPGYTYQRAVHPRRVGCGQYRVVCVCGANDNMRSAQPGIMQKPKGSLESCVRAADF